MKEAQVSGRKLNPILEEQPKALSITAFVHEIQATGQDFILISVMEGLFIGLVFLETMGMASFLAPLRLILGLPLGLFVPGYALQAALFPRQADLNIPERIALSTGISLAIIPILAFCLDKLPWGIRLWPIIFSLALVSIVSMLGASYRRWHLPPEDRFVPSVDVNLKGWWEAQNRSTQRFTVLCGALFGLALLSAMVIILTPKSDEHFTEFYMLGPDGLAESFPSTVTLGQNLQVTIGINNHEGRAHIYRGEILVGNRLTPGQIKKVSEFGPYRLENGQSKESTVHWTMPQMGKDQEVHIWLYIDGQPEPYRKLLLILDVNKGNQP